MCRNDCVCQHETLLSLGTSSQRPIRDRRNAHDVSSFASVLSLEESVTLLLLFNQASSPINLSIHLF